MPQLRIDNGLTKTLLKYVDDNNCETVLLTLSFRDSADIVIDEGIEVFICPDNKLHVGIKCDER